MSSTIPPAAVATLYPLNPHEAEVLAQTLQFEAALPELLEMHSGRWAVWLDGLQSVHDTDSAALAWGYEHLGDRDFTIMQVAEHRPASLSGLAAFGL